jgi:hypothetical protein
MLARSRIWFYGMVRSMKRAIGIASMVLAANCAAQQAARKPFQSQATSSIVYRVDKGEEIIETTNVAWQVTGTDIPGRPKNERLVLRITAKQTQTLGDIGSDAKVTVEAWTMGMDLESKPRYSVTQTGVEAHTLENALLQFGCGTEEVEWWSVYQLGTGKHLFDTHVPLVNFSTSRDIFTSRYGGLDVPPDDATDVRLKEPHIVAVLVYASSQTVIREALITADDVNRAKGLRSYADTHRTVTLRESPSLPPILRIRFVSNDKAEKETLLEVPITKDDLDLDAAKVPAGLQVKAWKR